MCIRDRLQDSANTYRENPGNERTRDQIIYWLDCWQDTTEAIINYLEAAKGLQNGADNDEIWDKFSTCLLYTSIDKLIKHIKNNNVDVGIAIKPDTCQDVLKPFLSQLDLVLVMSVEPGFGGQTFNHSAIEKISKLAKLREENNYHYLIEVDGGINESTAKLCRQTGDVYKRQN